MNIKRLSVLALSLALMLVMSGCEVVSVNRDKDMAQVVAEVGDRKITKQEIYDQVDEMLASQGVDIFDEKLSSDMRDYVEENYLLPLLEAEIEEELIKQKADEMAIELTEEEITEAEDNVQSYVDMIKAVLAYDDENPDDYEGDIEADVDEYMLSSTGYTRDGYLELILLDTKTQKLKEEITKDVEASEEEIKAKYDDDLKAQKDVFSTDSTDDEAEASPSPTATDDELLDETDSTDTDPDTAYSELASAGGSAGSYVLYKPAGYRIVKHILLEFTEEDQAKIDEANEKINELSEIVSPVEESINEANSVITSAEERIAELKGEVDAEATETPEAEVSASPEASISIESMTEEEKQAAIEEQEQLIADKEDEIDVLTKGMAADQAALSDAEEEKENLRQQAADNLQPTVDEIKSRNKAGEDFDDLIEEYNTDEGMSTGYGKAYGYLLDQEGSGFVNEFSEAALSLEKVGDLSEPAMSSYGVHVIRLEMDAEAADVPYEKAKLVVKEMLDTEAADTKWEESLEQWNKDFNVKIHESRLKFIK